MQFIFILMSTWALSALAEETRIVDQIVIEDAGDKTRIRINFNVPLQYINHVPPSHGDKIVVQFRPVLTSQISEFDFSIPESLSWDPTPNVPLQFVRYEGGTQQRVQIGVYFRTDLDFEVQPSPDARSISILVAKPEPEVTAPAPVPAPAPAPVPSQPPTVTDAQATAPGDTVAVDDIQGRYTLNLESSTEIVTLPDRALIDLPGPLVIYTIASPVDGRLWNRIRVGFFETKDAAQSALERLKVRYPRAWLAAATEQERQEAFTNGVVVGAGEMPVAPLPGAPIVPKPRPETIPTLPALPQEKLDALMEEARQAMAGGDYPRGIQLYTKILQHQDTGKHQEAQEFLAFARERNGQLAHAKLAYETYLQRYPEGPGADRVRQRLAGLNTARMTPKGKLRATEREQLGPYWEMFGSFSQYYRRDTSKIVEQDALADARIEETRVNQSSLSNDLDITGRRRGGAVDVDTRFSGGYEADFLSEDEGPGDLSRVSSLYADLQDRKRGLGGRFGRQTRNTGGVLGRFDGALLSYQLNPTVKLNAVSGFPVDSSKDSPDTERLFYGLSADFGTYANAWDFVAFIIEQQIDDLLDRQAIGGEVRYFDPVKSLITHVDYDISYEQVNTFLMLGNWNLPDNYAANATIDIRQSPVLTTRNAIQGQGVESIEDLRALFTEDQLRDLAEDRTADSESYTVGLSRQMSERFQITGDVTLSKIGSTPASGGVEVIPGTGNEYFYNLQLIGSNLLKENDITILGMRYSDTSTSDTTSLLINHRYPVNRVWRLNPRFRVDFRENKNIASEQWIYAPSMQMDYLWRKRYRFELETGGEWSERQLTDSSEDTRSYFVYMGYRADF